MLRTFSALRRTSGLGRFCSYSDRLYSRSVNGHFLTLTRRSNLGETHLSGLPHTGKHGHKATFVIESKAAITADGVKPLFFSHDTQHLGQLCPE